MKETIFILLITVITLIVFIIPVMIIHCPPMMWMTPLPGSSSSSSAAQGDHIATFTACFLPRASCLVPLAYCFLLLASCFLLLPWVTTPEAHLFAERHFGVFAKFLDYVTRV